MLEITTGICSNCKKSDQPIVNKKYYICPNCNRTRLDNQSGTKKIKQNQLLKKVGLKRLTKPIARFSTKRQVIENDYKKVQAEMVASEPHRCSGCHETNRPLSYSHLIPRSLRKDLIACRENIKPHCLEWNGIMGCHEKWERGLWKEMKDLEENLEIVKKLDEKYYNLIINKFNKDEIQEN